MRNVVNADLPYIVCTRDRPISCCWDQYRYFKSFFTDIWASCRHSIGHRYQYSKIRLPIYLPIL